jgi:pheromone shutdown protein TraB
MLHKIPQSLMKQLIVLKTPKSLHSVYLIGTAHISQDSCNSVKALIDIVKPRVVFFELCEQRKHIMEDSDESAIVQQSFKEDVTAITSGETNLFAIAYSKLLRQWGKDLNSQPGGEFKAGFDAAQSCNAAVVLGDRDVFITIQRVWNGLTFFEKSCIACSFLGMIFSRPSKDDLKEIVENVKGNEDVLLSAIIEMGQCYPWLVESLIFERDLYMLHTLLKTLEQLEGEERCDIVAIVGAGHMAGIAQRWEKEIMHPGSEVCSNNILDIMKVPGRVTNSNQINLSDLR